MEFRVRTQRHDPSRPGPRIRSLPQGEEMEGSTQASFEKHRCRARGMDHQVLCARGTSAITAERTARKWYFGGSMCKTLVRTLRHDPPRPATQIEYECDMEQQ